MCVHSFSLANQLHPLRCYVSVLLVVGVACRTVDEGQQRAEHLRVRVLDRYMGAPPDALLLSFISRGTAAL
jgi:hypothetical protein